MPTTPLHNGLAIELPRILTAPVAAELGLTRSTVRHAVARGWWLQLLPGLVLTAPGPPTRHDCALAGLALSSPAGAVSGWDAVRVRGLGASDPPVATVLILDRCGEHRVAGGVRIRPTSRAYSSTMLPAEHPSLPFVPIVSTARALSDTALCYRTAAPVRALVTAAVQRRRCTPAELVAELDTGPRNGSRPLRQAVSDVLVGARSIAEAEAVDYLRRAAVPAFELNVPIVDVGGELVAVADVLWRELRAVGEIDSAEFHFLQQGWKDTTHRHNRLTSAGLALEHFPPSEIRTRRMGWARDIEHWLRARALELGVRYFIGNGPIQAPGSGPPPLVLPGLRRRGV